MRKYIIFVLTFVGFWSSQPILAQQSRYTNHNEVGMLPYNLSFKEVGLTVQTFNGYLLNPDLAIGATLGYDKFTVKGNHKFAVIPVSLSVRYTFLEPKTTRMFASLDAGYGFAWETETNMERDIKGGLRFNPAIGTRWTVGEGKSFMTLSLGYQYQHIKADYFTKVTSPVWYDLYMPYSTRDYKQQNKIDVHRMVLKLGFGF